MSKLNWDDYFFGIMHAVAARASCDRGRSGCVITKNNRILVSGYVGSIAGGAECDEVGHLLEKVIHADGSISEHCHRTLHAEQNCISQSSRMGIALEGSTLYCTMTPCRVCAMLIIQSGIKKVMCEAKYNQSHVAEEMFKQAGIEIIFKSEEVVRYDNRMII
jgi:dCMP deaminase